MLILQALGLNDFKLLETAVEFREAFDELEQIDSDFKSINLTKEDWNEAEASPNLELNRYLKEPKFPWLDDFDRLTWWRMNAQNFPILARMARDFLAIPFSTTLSNSALKAKMQNLVYSVDLGSDIKEAFICTKFWLENP
ncbi:hypothetical protein WN943_016156 [Citrus x changshan-huyou]